MGLVDLVMPKMGESIMEATVLKWLKNVGDNIAQDEPVLEIATDKVDSEVPATHAGVLKEILFNVNDVVPIGTVIARIETEINQGNSLNGQLPNSQSEVKKEIPVAAKEVMNENQEDIPYQPTTAKKTISNAPRFYSPLVMNIAQQEGIGSQELESIVGTGADGRVSKKDILAYVEAKKQGKLASNSVTNTQVNVTAPEAQIKVQTESTPTKAVDNAVTVASVAATTVSGNVEIVEMDRMRKLIAKHMVDSKHTSAHVTSFAEADVTHLVNWRNKVKEKFEKQEGEKITFTPIFIEALVRCLKKFPLLNSSINGDQIIIKKDINIGMATALPTGNLIVPVIKAADQLNLIGLTKKVNSLANAARNNKLKPEDTQDGTFTLTNVGSFGSIMGTPIINQPQVAIMAVGAIKKRPVVIESEDGDSIAIRHMMYISMSYDHRIIDGALGGQFINAFAQELEKFDANREI